MDIIIARAEEDKIELHPEDDNYGEWTIFSNETEFYDVISTGELDVLLTEFVKNDIEELGGEIETDEHGEEFYNYDLSEMDQDYKISAYIEPNDMSAEYRCFISEQEMDEYNDNNYRSFSFPDCSYDNPISKSLPSIPASELRDATDEELNDKDFVIKSLSNNGSGLMFVSEELRKDKDVVMAAVSNFGPALKYASPELRNDIDIVKEAVSKYGIAYKFASLELQNNRDILIASLSAKEPYESEKIIKYAPYNYQRDMEIIKTALANNGLALEYVDDSLKKDKGIILAAVQNNGEALKYADYQDKEIVKEAINNKVEAIFYSTLDTSELTKDNSIPKLAIEKDEKGTIYKYFAEEVRADKEVAYLAATKNEKMLNYVPETIKEDIVSDLKENHRVNPFEKMNNFKAQREDSKTTEKPIYNINDKERNDDDNR